MKIAFDGQLLLEENRTGIAWNAHNLILELLKYPENTCILQCFEGRRAVQYRDRLNEYVEAGCNLEWCRWFRYPLYKVLWAVFPVPHRIFFHGKPDITQFFNFSVPPGAKGKRVTFIHDMAYCSCPQTVDKKTRMWLKLSMKSSCKQADHIVTVSAFSKREIIRYLHVPEHKITVIPNAADHTAYHPDYTKEQIQEVLNRLGIEQEYFLYMGTIEPRKNLERLINAYARLCREREHVPQLILAGKKGWLCDGIYRKAGSYHLEKKILLPGYIRQEDSPILMCGAKAFVFPSLYEGFGMPALEAMACGTPVITSNTTSLPEVVGDAGICVNPKSTREIYQAMKRILDDDGLRKKLQKKGLERARGYTWEKSAEMLMDVYRMLVQNCMERESGI